MLDKIINYYESDEIKKFKIQKAHDLKVHKLYVNAIERGVVLAALTIALLLVANYPTLTTIIPAIGFALTTGALYYFKK